MDARMVERNGVVVWRDSGRPVTSRRWVSRGTGRGAAVRFAPQYRKSGSGRGGFRPPTDPELRARLARGLVAYMLNSQSVEGDGFVVYQSGIIGTSDRKQSRNLALMAAFVREVLGQLGIDAVTVLTSIRRRIIGGAGAGSGVAVRAAAAAQNDMADALGRGEPRVVVRQNARQAEREGARKIANDPSVLFSEVPQFHNPGTIWNEVKDGAGAMIDAWLNPDAPDVDAWEVGGDGEEGVDE